jgi:hypothetical protein
MYTKRGIEIIGMGQYVPTSTLSAKTVAAPIGFPFTVNKNMAFTNQSAIRYQTAKKRDNPCRPLKVLFISAQENVAYQHRILRTWEATFHVHVSGDDLQNPRYRETEEAQKKLVL